MRITELKSLPIYRLSPIESMMFWLRFFKEAKLDELLNYRTSIMFIEGDNWALYNYRAPNLDLLKDSLASHEFEYRYSKLTIVYDDILGLSLTVEYAHNQIFNVLAIRFTGEK